MKYFDKDFFKFTLGFLSIVSISLLLIAAVSAYAAEVNKIAFTTDLQTIKPGVLSAPITVQTQDASGTSIQTLETIDLTFISTSPSGEFLNSSGNAASLTMSKNTSNRTFYYKDLTEGKFTITVTAKGRESGIEWSAGQSITVSSSAVVDNTNDDDNDGAVLGATTGSATTGGGSSTSGPSSASSGSNTSQLEVVAGQDRLTSPGSPLSFQVTVKKNTASSGKPEFAWSFGDGTVAEGSFVSHTYKYPGEYAVVLNAKAGGAFSTSRLKVKVVEPKLSIKAEGEYVEISNQGKDEINLFQWRVENNGRGFIFQPDTIILPNSKVRFDNSLFSLKWASTSDAVLKDSLNRVLVSEVKSKPISVNTIAIGEELDKIRIQALSISKILEVKSPEVKVAALAPKVVAKIEPPPPRPTEVAAILAAVPLPLENEASTTENVLYEAKEEEGAFKKLTNFIKSIFSD